MEMRYRDQAVARQVQRLQTRDQPAPLKAGTLQPCATALQRAQCKPLDWPIAFSSGRRAYGTVASGSGTRRRRSVGIGRLEAVLPTALPPVNPPWRRALRIISARIHSLLSRSGSTRQQRANVHHVDDIHNAQAFQVASQCVQAAQVLDCAAADH